MKRLWLLLIFAATAHAQSILSGFFDAQPSTAIPTWGNVDYWLQLPTSACPNGSAATATEWQNGTVGTPTATWTAAGSNISQITCGSSVSPLTASVVVNGITIAPGTATQTELIGGTATLSTMNFTVPPGNTQVNGSFLYTTTYPDAFNAGDFDIDVRETPNTAFGTVQPFGQTGNGHTGTITSFSITSNVASFVGTNNFQGGELVNVTGLTAGSYMNTATFGQMLVVSAIGLSSSGWQAAFVHANVSSTTDSGTATAPLYLRAESGGPTAHPDTKGAHDAGYFPNLGAIPILSGHTLLVNVQEDLVPWSGTITTSNGAIGSCPSGGLSGSGGCIQITGATHGLAAPLNYFWETATNAPKINGTGFQIDALYSTTVASVTTPPGTQTNVASTGPGLLQIMAQDPSSGYAQVGPTIQFGLDITAAYNQIASILLGNNESAGSAGAHSTVEDWFLQMYNPSFPNWPHVQSSPYASIVQWPAGVSCGFVATCTDTNVGNVTQNDIGYLVAEIPSTGHTLTGPTATGAGCSSTVWVAVPGVAFGANSTQVQVWRGVMSGTGACQPSYGISGSAAAEIDFLEMRKVTSGIVDPSTGASGSCATCTVLTLTGAAGTAVNNETGIVFYYNQGGSFAAAAPGWWGYNTSNTAFGKYLTTIPTAGTVPSFKGTIQNAATALGGVILTMEP